MNQMKNKKNLKDDREFWVKTINKDINKSSFSDCTLNNNKLAYDTINFDIPKEISSKILMICNNSNIGVYIYLISAIQYILKKCSGNDEVLIGIEDLKKQKFNDNCGNILMFKSMIYDDDTFKEFLCKSKEMFINVNKFSGLSIQNIQQLTGVEDFDNKTAIIDTIVTLNCIDSNFYIEDFNLSTIINFFVNETNISCSIKYNTNSVSKSRVKSIESFFINFLSEVTSNSNSKLKMINIIEQKEIDKLTSFSNGKKVSFNREETLKSLFEKQVKKTPNNIAVKCLNYELTYIQLNKKANKLANMLIKSGLEKNEVIGLYFDRSIEMIIAIIATLKVGAAYLPINIDNPTERSKYIVMNSNTKKIITNNKCKNSIDFIGEENIFIIDSSTSSEEIQNPNTKLDADNLAYIIYTSGTTGTPKGCTISHRNIMNLIVGLQDSIYNNYDQILNIACLAPYYFDASVQQIFMSLINGHKLVIPTEDEKAIGDSILEFYCKNNIDISDGTPTHIKMLSNSLKADDYRLKVKHLIIGGEKLSYTVLKKFFDKNSNNNIQLNNIYGITECCVDSSIFLVNKENIKNIGNNILPIGKPLANQQIYVLDKNLNFVPIGVRGEIFISGDCVGKGYLENDDLTATRFIKDPFNKNSIMYKTGDLGKWNDEGDLEYMGRIDSQVKIRGYRIELEEVENAILTFKKNKNVVEDQVVTCKKCLMTSTSKNITFNKDGICNVCENYERYKDKVEDYFKDIDDFKLVMNKARKKSKSKYDCILLYSGGKDSSYVLYNLVEMGYKVLAFTFDNGYISERAFKNIKKITSDLNVDSIICSSENMNEIFVESLKSDATVCSGCFKALTTISTKIAFENDINVIITGLSKGQIMDTKLQSIMELEMYDNGDIDTKLLELRGVYHKKNDRINELLNIELENEKFNDTYFIDFFRYANSSSDNILKYLQEKDKEWIAPEDTGFCSSNCLINDVGIYVHLKNRGFHNYMIPLSWDCRLGLASKDSATQELNDNLNMEGIHSIMKEIGYEEAIDADNVIEEVVVLNKIDSFGDSYLVAYYTAKEKVLISQLKNHLMEKLPHYEVPSYYVQVEKIFKTVNGKVDFNQLMNIKISGCRNSKYEAPRNEIEKKLVKIWTEILEIENISIKDSFFELGGHSINAMVLSSRIYEEFNVEILITDILKLATIETIAIYIEKNKFTKDYLRKIKKVEVREFYPVSSSQKRMFILQNLKINDTTYNVHSTKFIKGELDINKLEQCFINLINRHEILRTSFEFNGNDVVQVIEESINFKIERIEGHNVNIDDLILSLIKPFDLSKAPLIRVAVINLKDDNYIMFIDIHHICTDAIALKILMKELEMLYNGENLSNVELQYKDFSCLQVELLKSSAIQEQRQYWYNKLSDYDFSKDIFKKYRMNNSNERRTERIKFKIGNTLKSQLEALCITNKATLYSVALTAYVILLYKFSGQEDIVIGTPVAGRQYINADNIVGAFINTLPIRSFINSNKTINELLNHIKENMYTALENQDYPFDNIVNDLNVVRKDTENILFNVMFTLNNINYKELSLKKLDTVEYDIKSDKGMVDLSLDGEILNNEMKFYFEYNNMIFSRKSVEKFVYNYIKILRSMTNLNCKVKDIQLEIIKS
ncbi:amino acid adenylation domain-containing protein [Clostridium botulinum]|nr:amino acid adenylation domain-containing protein [Clostridium botulinum]